MNIALWIITGLLALAFLGAGLTKATSPKDKLKEKGMAWTEDFSATQVKAIGTLEVLAAIGLILPAAFNIVPVLVPIAAAGLALTMVGAVVTHVRRSEKKEIIPSLVLGSLAILVAIGRFGPCSF